MSKMRIFIVLLTLLMSINIAYANESEEIVAIGTYRLGDKDTREAAKKFALLDATRQISDQAGVYVESYTEVNNFELNQDQIKVLASSIIKKISERIEWEENGTLCKAYVTAKVNTDRLEQLIKKMPALFNGPSQKDNQSPSTIINNNIIDNSIINNYNHSLNPPKYYAFNDPLMRSFNGHYYRVYNEDSDWFLANQRCRSLGGYLVCITSKEESDFIDDIVTRCGNKDYYWTGGIKNKSGNWQWVTGEQFNFQNWSTKHYNTLNNTHNAMIIDFYDVLNIKWDSTEATGGMSANRSKFGFICEWNEYPYPPGFPR